jgi:hypothetical protein
MHSYLLQDWITIRGTSTSTVITQGEVGWLDLAPYQDVNFWIDCRETVGGSVYLNFQTSPTKEDFLFQAGAMFGATAILMGTTTAASNPWRVLLTQAANKVPLARYVRWQLTGPATTPWDVSFRVLVTANALGL